MSFRIIYKPLFLTKVNQAFDKLWFIFQPLLFGILGARTDFSLVDWSVVGQGAICLAISTVVSILNLPNAFQQL